MAHANERTPSVASVHALDAVNLFLAAALAGFGPLTWQAKTISKRTGRRQPFSKRGCSSLSWAHEGRVEVKTARRHRSGRRLQRATTDARISSSQAFASPPASSFICVIES
jgi:hypothetical protein